jgi:hypothetical protein
MRLGNRLNLRKCLSRRKSRPITRRPARPSLGIEILEERLAPAINPSSLFNPLAAPVSNLGNSLSSVLQSANTVLPIINQPLSSLAKAPAGAPGAIQSAIQNLISAINNPNLNELTNALNSAAPDKGQVAQAISDALPGLARNVNVVTLDAAGGNIEITMDLVKPLVTTAVPFSFATGLPGLPFRITANGKIGVTANFEYDHLDYGLSGGQFFLNNNQPGQVRLRLDAGVPAGASLIGQFGLLYVTATPTGSGVGLHGSVVADVTGTGSNLGLSGARLDAFTANADLRLTGQITPPAGPQQPGEDATEAKLSLPQIRADFHFSWDMSGADPSAGLAALGSRAPVVQLNNVQVGLGSFLSSAMAPILDVVQQVTAPIKPVLDVLSAPIPGLSDLGAGTVSLISIAGIVNDMGVVPPGLQQIVTLALALSQLVDTIDNAQIDGNIWINTGNFDLGQSNGDLRDLLQQAGSIDDLASNLSGDLSGLKVVGAIATKLGDLVNSQLSDTDPIQHAAKTAMQGVLRQLDSLNNGIHLTFPLIEDPLRGAVQLLLGKDADMVSLTADFVTHAGPKKLVDLPLWGPIHIGLEGSADISLHFKAAYDTYGFREFLANGLDPRYLADGLYIDSSKPLVDLHASITGSLEGMFPPPVEMVPNPVFPLGPPVVPAAITAGLDATLTGGFTLRLDDPTGSGSLRLFKDPLNGHLFDPQGSLSADLSFDVAAWLGPVKVDNIIDKQLGHITLFDSSKIVTTDPLNPPSTGSFPVVVKAPRTLYVANYAAAPGEPDEVNVYSIGPNLEAWVNGHCIQFDMTRTSELTIIGSGNDSMIVVQDPNLPVHVQAGAGNNTLIVDDTLFAPADNNVYHLTDHSISRSFVDGDLTYYPYTVDYTGVDDVRLMTPSASNQVYVDSLPAFPVTVQTTDWSLTGLPHYDSHNFITVAAHSLNDGCQLNVVGASDDDNLTILDDSAGGGFLGTVAPTYTITGNAITYQNSHASGFRLIQTTASVRFDGLKTVSLVGQDVTNFLGAPVGRKYSIDSWAGPTALNITGAGGDDTFDFGGGQMDNVSGNVRSSLPISINGGGRAQHVGPR